MRLPLARRWPKLQIVEEAQEEDFKRDDHENSTWTEHSEAPEGSCSMTRPPATRNNAGHALSRQTHKKGKTSGHFSVSENIDQRPYLDANLQLRHVLLSSECACRPPEDTNSTRPWFVFLMGRGNPRSPKGHFPSIRPAIIFEHHLQGRRVESATDLWRGRRARRRRQAVWPPWLAGNRWSKWQPVLDSSSPFPRGHETVLCK